MGKLTDATRAERKAKKRALEAAIPDLPGDDNVEVSTEPEKKEKDKSKKRKRGGEEEAAAVTGEEVKSKKSKKDKKRKESEVLPEVSEVVENPVKKEKKSKKDKKPSKSEDELRDEGVPAVDVDAVMEEVAEAPKKSKKERKAERRAKEALSSGATTVDDAIEPVPETNENEDGIKKSKKQKEKSETETSEEQKSKKNNRNREKKRKAVAEGGEGGEEKDKKPARFIVFVGNLPFSATTESIKAHFASVHPQSVRHLTKKEDPTKSKGCAFVEFAGYDHMKTCLKLMHHSTFDDGKSAPRKINVELTAGGGGNTTDRKNKIEAKNAKLNEERIRKIHEEEKVKLEKAGAAAIDESAIHPSRRGRVPILA